MLRSTLIGGGIGAAAFALLGLYLNVATGADPLSNPGPMAVLIVVGGTIGGLVGPLFGSRRLPSERSDRPEREPGTAAGESGEGNERPG